MEPGTLAMFLLPAITYAFFNKKRIGLLILLIAFFLTYSLGGIISLLILIVIISFIKFNRQKKYLIFAILIAFLMSGLLWIYFGDTILEKYKGKNISAKVRENNFTKAFTNFPKIVINNPIGLKLSENTKSFEKNKYYIGSNFSPEFYLQYGGISALVGYLICLSVSFMISLRSLKRDDLSIEEKVVFTSILVLLPFILQRSTIWDCSLFAFLFAPSIIRVIEKIKSNI
jgi:MFS family permease